MFAVKTYRASAVALKNIDLATGQHFHLHADLVRRALRALHQTDHLPLALAIVLCSHFQQLHRTLALQQHAAPPRAVVTQFLQRSTVKRYFLHKYGQNRL